MASVALLFFSCNNTEYNFSNPSEIFVLSKELGEISGLSYDSSTGYLVAINDEQGYYYSLNPDNGEIVTSHKFGKKGDYESIEVTENNIIIMNNKGDLFFVNKKTKETSKVNTPFSPRNDLEGMALSSDKRSLYLACKGQSYLHEKSKKKKYVYSFDLASQVLDTIPYLKISDKKLVNFYKAKDSKLKAKKVNNRLKSFASSGIAVHPTSNDIYIISARGSSLVIFNADKKLKDVVLLNSKLNPQPEGICFDGQGNLYISTEGAGFSGKVFKYKPL